MTTHTSRIVLVGRILAAPCLAAVAAFAGETEFTRTITAELPFANMETLLVDGDNGSIDIQPWDQQTVAIEATIRLRLGRPPAPGRPFETDQEAIDFLDTLDVTLESTGAGASVVWDFPNVEAVLTAEVVINVPAQVDVEAVLSNGAIFAQDLTGAFSIDLSNGIVDVAGLTGPIVVDLSNGEFEAGDHQGLVDAEIDNGFATVSLRMPPIETESVDLSIANGGLQLTLPEDSAISVMAEVNIGFISTAIGGVRREGLGQRLDREVNGGGAPITLSASNGQIVINGPSTPDGGPGPIYPGCEAGAPSSGANASGDILLVSALCLVMALVSRNNLRSA